MMESSKGWSIVAVMFGIAAVCQGFVAVIHFKNVVEKDAVEATVETETCERTLPQVTRAYPAELVRVIDGDTFELNIQVWEDLVLTKTIRLLGVDTPELHPRTGTDEQKLAEKAKAAAAKEFVEKAMAQKVLFFVSEGKSDSFGRALGTVIWYVDTGEVDICQELRRAELLK